MVKVITPFRLWVVYRYIDNRVVYASISYSSAMRVARSCSGDCAIVRCDSTEFWRNIEHGV